MIVLAEAQQNAWCSVGERFVVISWAFQSKDMILNDSFPINPQRKSAMPDCCVPPWTNNPTVTCALPCHQPSHLNNNIQHSQKISQLPTLLCPRYYNPASDIYNQDRSFCCMIWVLVWPLCYSEKWWNLNLECLGSGQNISKQFCSVPWWLCMNLSINILHMHFNHQLICQMV